MTYKSEESLKLYNVLIKRGLSPELSDLISGELRTSWTANRMLGYLRQLPYVSEVEIVDEMLAIVSDRDRIMQKKEAEFYQAKMNELYYYDFGEEGNE